MRQLKYYKEDGAALGIWITYIAKLTSMLVILKLIARVRMPCCSAQWVGTPVLRTENGHSTKISHVWKMLYTQFFLAGTV